MAADQQTPELGRLTAECPEHGAVRVVCPRCAGKAGGRAHKGTRSKLGHELRDACKVLDAHDALRQEKGPTSTIRLPQKVESFLVWGQSLHVAGNEVPPERNAGADRGEDESLVAD